MRLVRRGVFAGGTRKYLLETKGRLVESVLRPVGETGCEVSFSSQVGCPVGCDYCATGNQGFVRNLTPEEIIAQVGLVSKEARLVPVRLVAGSQGEPLLNIDAVGYALAVLREAYDIREKGAVRLSTCGVIDGIRHLKRSGYAGELALNMAFIDQHERDCHMSGAAQWPLARVRGELRAWQGETNGTLIVECGLFGTEDADSIDRRANELACWCAEMSTSVEVYAIDVPGSPGVSHDAKARFTEMLNARGIDAKVLPDAPRQLIGMKHFPAK